eukprot:scaffold71442_cov56-Phaeocystis_antarctica.AAC.4
MACARPDRPLQTSRDKWGTRCCAPGRSKRRRRGRLCASTRAPLQPLFGIQAARTLLSGPGGSRGQAGGRLERRVAAWAAVSGGTLTVRVRLALLVPSREGHAGRPLAHILDHGAASVPAKQRLPSGHGHA